MKAAATAIAFGVALLVSVAAQAQSDTPSAEPPQVEAAPSSEAQIPAASSAPVVEMERFCRRREEMRYYPVQALQRGIEGDVVLDCVVGDDHLRTCQVVEERPADMGFGDASLTIACRIRILPDATSTETTQLYERDGELHVRRTIRWRLQ